VEAAHQELVAQRSPVIVVHYAVGAGRLADVLVTGN
jgi:hypothetical protein